jgi:hypothetical protein
MKRFPAVGLALLFLVTVVFGVFLLSRPRNLPARSRRADASQEELSGMGLLRFTIGLPHFCQMVLEKNGQAEKPELSLVVFLSQGDCACLREAEIWEKLYKKYSPKGFLVAGIVPRPDSQWSRQFLEDYDLSFPVISVNPALLQAIGVPPVAFKVIVDSQHRVVYMSGANSEPEDQKNFAEVAERLCEVYLQPTSNKLGLKP